MRQAIFRVAIAMLGSVAFGQTFEVASVKRSPPVSPTQQVFFGPPRGGPGTADPSQITWTYATLKGVLMRAFDASTYQVRGPEWLDSERYDFIVKLPQGTTKEQVRAMWQNVLAERFGMTLHHEPKEFQVSELVIAKGGHKLRETAIDAAALLEPGPPKFEGGKLTGPGMVTMVRIGTDAPHGVATARAQPISQLATMVGNQLRHPVLDKTGLTGRYDFEFEFTVNLIGVPPPPAELRPTVPGADAGDRASDRASDPGTDIGTALQKQLGLRLVANKAKLDVIVVDKAEKVPTEN